MRGSDGYRRRNLVPVAVLVIVLAVASVVVWSFVFASSTSGSVTSCNISPVPGAGTVVAASALDEQAAAAPGDVRVRVLNGAGQRGQANLASTELNELGIAEAAPPDNDNLFPAQDLTCVGQIRFGVSGYAAARTLSLVVPCAELVVDGRTDDSVDLALGSDFRDITPGAEVIDALRGLARQSASGTPVPGTDPASLTGVRAVDCSS